MDEAKAKELNEWIVEQVVAKVKESEKVPAERLLNMRWVLTWKPCDEGVKAKARIVILGYQHPELTELKVSSPTLSTTK